MREVFVYVEGPSDQLGLRNLFENISQQATGRGNSLDFYSMGGKKPLLNKGPFKALNILRNKPESQVFLVPDLYPQNEPFPHTNYDELKNETEKRFNDELKQRGLDENYKNRFFVHCFKYDLEVLLLASEKMLIKRLGVDKITSKWKKPVEDQNHDKPPKRVVEELFRNCGKKYKGTVDAPWILERSDCYELRDICDQNFKPFFDDLLNVLQLG